MQLEEKIESPFFLLIPIKGFVNFGSCETESNKILLSFFYFPRSRCLKPYIHCVIESPEKTPYILESLACVCLRRAISHVPIENSETY